MQVFGISSRCRSINSAVRAQSGAALVELALMLPLLVLLLLGVTDIGRMFYYSIVVNNAARAGAGYAAFTGKYSESEWPAMKSKAVQDAFSSVPDFTTANIPIATHFCRCPGSPQEYPACVGSPETCIGYGSPQVYVRVETSYTFNTLFNWPGIPDSVSLGGRAIMRVQ